MCMLCTVQGLQLPLHGHDAMAFTALTAPAAESSFGSSTERVTFPGTFEGSNLSLGQQSAVLRVDRPQ